MTQEDKYKLEELVSDYESKVMDRDYANNQHWNYIKSSNYKCGSNESFELGNKAAGASLAVMSAAERLAEFISKKIKEIN